MERFVMNAKNYMGFDHKRYCDIAFYAFQNATVNWDIVFMKFGDANCNNNIENVGKDLCPIC